MKHNLKCDIGILAEEVLIDLSVFFVYPKWVEYLAFLSSMSLEPCAACQTTLHLPQNNEV